MDIVQALDVIDTLVYYAAKSDFAALPGTTEQTRYIAHAAEARDAVRVLLGHPPCEVVLDQDSLLSIPTSR